MNERKRIWVVLHLESGEEIDLDIPSDITVEDFLEGLKYGFGWAIETEEIRRAHLRSENPVALLKGDHTLEEYQLRDGSILYFSFPRKGKQR